MKPHRHGSSCTYLLVDRESGACDGSIPVGDAPRRISLRPTRGQLLCVLRPFSEFVADREPIAMRDFLRAATIYRAATVKPRRPR